MKRILVANRGDIACRINSSTRSLEIETVAVYSEADAEAFHVGMADEADCLGPSLAAQSYLKQDALLDVARTTGVEAVHPGDGLLFENATFVQAVTDAGLTWIGPSPETIADMGNKGGALAIKADVPVLPGSRALPTVR